MAKRMKPLPVGTVFANGWRILEHWNCAESVFNGLGGKNSHYLCTNDNCGATYAFENSNVRRWIDGEVQRLQRTWKMLLLFSEFQDNPKGNQQRA